MRYFIIAQVQMVYIWWNVYHPSTGKASVPRQGPPATHATDRDELVPLSFLPLFLLSSFSDFGPPELDPALFLGSRSVRAQLRARGTKKCEDSFRSRRGGLES